MRLRRSSSRIHDGSLCACAAHAYNARLDDWSAEQRLHSDRARCRAIVCRIDVVYALRNALLPVLTVIGIIFSVMLGANVLVEKVFSWPGVGSYALDALLSADYAPVQGFVLMMASIFVAINLLIDLLYGIADPRVSIT